MDQHIGFLFDYYIYRFEEIVIDLLLAEVHAAVGIEAVERDQAKVCISDVG